MGVINNFNSAETRIISASPNGSHLFPSAAQTEGSLRIEEDNLSFSFIMTLKILNYKVGRTFN